MKKKEYEFKFIKDNPDAEKRKLECEKITNQFPDKIPIICEKDPESKILNKIEKTKFLIPNTFTVGKFNLMIRKKLNIGEEEGKNAIFLLAKAPNAFISLVGDAPLSQVYENYKNPQDGFLYIIYTSEIFMGTKNVTFKFKINY